jgi:hypothetical protein
MPQWVPSADLGSGQRQAGFLPLPLADNRGTLIGTQLWRTRSPGLVKCIQLYRSGLALAWLVLSPPETEGRTCSS